MVDSKQKHHKCHILILGYCSLISGLLSDITYLSQSSSEKEYIVKGQHKKPCCGPMNCTTNILKYKCVFLYKRENSGNIETKHNSVLMYMFFNVLLLIFSLIICTISFQILHIISQITLILYKVDCLSIA